MAAEMLLLSGESIVWRTDATRDLGYDAGPQRWVEVYRSTGSPCTSEGFRRGLRYAHRCKARVPKSQGIGPSARPRGRTLAF